MSALVSEPSAVATLAQKTSFGKTAVVHPVKGEAKLTWAPDKAGGADAEILFAEVGIVPDAAFQMSTVIEPETFPKILAPLIEQAKVEIPGIPTLAVPVAMGEPDIGIVIV
jgi:hypothetical protein